VKPRQSYSGRVDASRKVTARVRLPDTFDEPRIGVDGLILRGWVPHEIAQLAPVDKVGGRALYRMSDVLQIEADAHAHDGPASRRAALPPAIKPRPPAPAEPRADPFTLDPLPVAPPPTDAETIAAQRQARAIRDDALAQEIIDRLRGAAPQREALAQQVDVVGPTTAPEPTPAPAPRAVAPPPLSPDDADFDYFAERPAASFRLRGPIEPAEHCPAPLRVIVRCSRSPLGVRIERRPVDPAAVPGALLRSDLTALWLAATA
jgi:hypothetical protein